MAQWNDKELKLLKKMVKKKKPLKKITKEFEKKRFNKNIFEILSKVRSLPELRPSFQGNEWTLEDIDRLVDEVRSRYHYL
jgi:hypothetical protein